MLHWVAEHLRRRQLGLVFSICPQSRSQFIATAASVFSHLKHASKNSFGLLIPMMQEVRRLRASSSRSLATA